MAVTASVPGISGEIFVNNAAEDSTLQAILAVLKAQSGTDGIDSKGVQSLNARSRQAGSSITKLSGSFGSLSETVSATAGSLAMVGNSMSGLMKSMTQAGNRMGGMMSNSMEQSLGEVHRVMAAGAGALPGIFKGIGGTVVAGFGLISGAMAKQADAYNTAAQSGFSFGYSMDNMRNIANSANLSMTQLTKVMQKSSSAMALFGGGTTQGARQFATLNKQVQTNVGGALLRMGIGFEEQGVRTADTIERLMLAGMSMDEIARSGDVVSRETRKRAEVESQLAKINGVTLQQQREEQKQQQQSNLTQAALMGATPKQKEAMEGLTAQMDKLAPGMGKLALEYFKFGGAVSESGGVLESQLGSVAGPMQEFIQRVKSGGAEMGDLPGFLASIDKGALDQERASLGDIAATAGLTGTNLGALGTVAGESVVGLQKFSAQLGADVFNKVIKDNEELRKEAGKVTTGMTNMAMSMQNAGVQLSSAMTGLIEGEVGTGIVKTNTAVMQGLATFATKLHEFTDEEVNPALKKLFGDPTARPVSSGGRGGGQAEVDARRAQQAKPAEETGSFFKDLLDRINPFNKGTLGTLGTMMGDFGDGTLAMLHGREAVITEDQMSNMLSNVNAFRENTLGGLADQMTKFGGAVTEEAAIAQMEQTSASSNVVSLSGQDREILSQIAVGNNLIAQSVNNVGRQQVEILEEVKMNTG